MLHMLLGQRGIASFRAIAAKANGIEGLVEQNWVAVVIDERNGGQVENGSTS